MCVIWHLFVICMYVSIDGNWKILFPLQFYFMECLWMSVCFLICVRNLSRKLKGNPCQTNFWLSIRVYVTYRASSPKKEPICIAHDFLMTLFRTVHTVVCRSFLLGCRYITLHSKCKRNARQILSQVVKIFFMSRLPFILWFLALRLST